ncbi:hypothetical protein [Streptomyces carpinensis]|uniref:Regulatory protein n=1 Tax=Streptomyces carpinensis TaxID=66369 RepID=A0ABV1WF61_9ACTN|nr:hypothetical protein [Streptomyces carpinensis]
MSETDVTATGLTTQYAAQVATDLERNLKEQERITGEIALLQEQLATLQHDHAVLQSVQQALGVTSAPHKPTADVPAVTVPNPRKKAATEPSRSKQTRAKKSAAPSRGSAPAKSPSKKKADAATGSQAAQPKLVDLVREHLAGQSEPRSAAEITTTLGRQYPERTVKTTVVRTTLEGLVAKKQAQRTKQGTSVFYTAETAAHGEQASAESV